jgi:hypothetical protein
MRALIAHAAAPESVDLYVTVLRLVDLPEQ